MGGFCSMILEAETLHLMAPEHFPSLLCLIGCRSPLVLIWCWAVDSIYLSPSVFLCVALGHPPKPQWTPMRWGGSSYWPASGGMNRVNLQLFMPWMTWGCLLYGACLYEIQVSVFIIFMSCKDGVPKSQSAQVDGRGIEHLCQNITCSRAKSCGIWKQSTHQGYTEATEI